MTLNQWRCRIRGRNFKTSMNNRSNENRYFNSFISFVSPFFVRDIIFLILKFTKDKTKKVSNLRFFIQIVAVVAVFMGLIIGPFGLPQWLPLGISPRDRLIGADFFGSQFPDGLSVPILACYYPNGRTVTCPIWQIQAYIFPHWDIGRGYEVF